MNNGLVPIVRLLPNRVVVGVGGREGVVLANRTFPADNAVSDQRSECVAVVVGLRIEGYLALWDGTAIGGDFESRPHSVTQLRKWILVDASCPKSFRAVSGKLARGGPRPVRSVNH